MSGFGPGAIFYQGTGDRITKGTKRDGRYEERRNHERHERKRKTRRRFAAPVRGGGRRAERGCLSGGPCIPRIVVKIHTCAEEIQNDFGMRCYMCLIYMILQEDSFAGTGLARANVQRL